MCNDGLRTWLKITFFLAVLFSPSFSVCATAKDNAPEEYRQSKNTAKECIQRRLLADPVPDAGSLGHREAVELLRRRGLSHHGGRGVALWWGLVGQGGGALVRDGLPLAGVFTLLPRAPLVELVLDRLGGQEQVGRLARIRPGSGG